MHAVIMQHTTTIHLGGILNLICSFDLAVALVLEGILDTILFSLR